MDEQEAALPVDEGICRHPVAEFVGVGSFEHRRERVPAVVREHAFAPGEEVQVVVAQHRHHRVAPVPRPAQHPE